MSIALQHDEIQLALAADPELRYLTRGWTAVLRFEQPDRCDDLTLVDGAVSSFARASELEPDVRIVGTDEGWIKLLAGDPAALWALITGRDPMLRVEGDLVGQLAPYGAALRRVIKVLRTVDGTRPIEVELSEDPFSDTDVAVGRYVRVEVDGVEYRMYYEEAGQGIPVLLQHTAGADSRQWRHFLADPELQAEYRMIAYDLPFHGRSLPPVRGKRWWDEAYEPGRDLLMKWVVAIKQALRLDRPLLMGVSVGGQLAADILAHHSDEFGGSVAMNGTYHNDSLSSFDNSPFNHPRITREFFSSLMYEATSPLAPEPLRRENGWIYSTNGAGIYKGDNLYYSHGHDLRVDGHLIDTAKTPLYAVVGEFDPVNGAPGGPQEIPDHIPGARFAVLPGLSHFAMSDDPVRFNAAIRPILDQVVSDSHFATPAPSAR